VAWLAGKPRRPWRLAKLNGQWLAFWLSVAAKAERSVSVRRKWREKRGNRKQRNINMAAMAIISVSALANLA